MQKYGLHGVQHDTGLHGEHGEHGTRAVKKLTLNQLTGKVNR